MAKLGYIILNITILDDTWLYWIKLGYIKLYLAKVGYFKLNLPKVRYLGLN